jgi:hypothetical protein
MGSDEEGDEMKEILRSLAMLLALAAVGETEAVGQPAPGAAWPAAGRQVLAAVGDGIANNCPPKGTMRCGPLYVDATSFGRLAEVDPGMTADSLAAWLGFGFQDLPTAQAYRCDAGTPLHRCDLAHRGTHLRLDSLTLRGDTLAVTVMATVYRGRVAPDPRHGSHELVRHFFVREEGGWREFNRWAWHPAS